MSSLQASVSPEILAQQSLPFSQQADARRGLAKASEAQLQAASSGRPAGSWSCSSALHAASPGPPARPAWGDHQALGTCHGRLLQLLPAPRMAVHVCCVHTRVFHVCVNAHTCRVLCACVYNDVYTCTVSCVYDSAGHTYSARVPCWPVDGQGARSWGAGGWQGCWRLRGVLGMRPRRKPAEPGPCGRSNAAQSTGLLTPARPAPPALHCPQGEGVCGRIRALDSWRLSPSLSSAPSPEALASWSLPDPECWAPRGRFLSHQWGRVLCPVVRSLRFPSPRAVDSVVVKWLWVSSPGNLGVLCAAGVTTSLGSLCDPDQRPQTKAPTSGQSLG